MTRRPALLLLSLLTVLAFSFALAACGGGGGDDDDRDDDSRPEDSDRDGVRDSRDDCRNEDEDDGVWGSDPKDGCPGTIDDLVELARADIDFFWQQTFQNEGEGALYEPPLQFTAYTTEIETGCGLATLDNAFYCSADHSIYYDVSFLEHELETNGDFGPVLIIAHEWGHLVQSILGILDSTELLTIETELQADCLAGVWAADADERGLLEEGDFEEGMVALLRVGDPFGTDFFDPQAHGQPGQRIDSFNSGFNLGLEGCTLD